MNAALGDRSRLTRLLGFLEMDPGNASLLSEAVNEALAADQPDTAMDLLDRFGGTLSPELLNLRALAAIRVGAFEDAVARFGALRAVADNGSVRFNMAWALAKLDRWAEALDLLDDETLAISPRAPALKVHALHHLDRLDEALSLGATLAERHPHDERLMGALAIAALDNEAFEGAATYAAQAGSSHEGVLARGLLQLEDGQLAGALDLLKEAVRSNPGNPRAQLGMGVSLLLKGDYREAGEALDLAAEGWGDDIGSWLAAGWARLAAGEFAASRERLLKALAIDPNDADVLGALAILDSVEGRAEDAKAHAAAGLANDDQSVAVILARSLIEDGPQSANLLGLLKARSGSAGRTIEETIARLGITRSKP